MGGCRDRCAGAAGDVGRPGRSLRRAGDAAGHRRRHAGAEGAAAHQPHAGPVHRRYVCGPQRQRGRRSVAARGRADRSRARHRPAAGRRRLRRPRQAARRRGRPPPHQCARGAGRDGPRPLERRGADQDRRRSRPRVRRRAARRSGRAGHMGSCRMSDQGPGAPLGKGEIRFFDNYIPALEVGDYVLNVVQEINPKNTAIDEKHAAAQVFSVQGPRYTLPPDDVFSVFPPNDSVGIYDQFLPQIVLAKRDLPWERDVFDDRDDHAQAQTPWLALLMFFEGEQIAGRDALLEPAVPKWQPNRMRTAAIRASDFYTHAGSDTLWPALEREWYETDDLLQQTGCSIIDISPEAFALLVPKPADLRYLAHVRQVNASGKDSEVLKIAEAGWYAVLVGNRLPDPPAPGAPTSSNAAGRRNIVHLVSLEGFEDYASGKKALPSDAKRVRMLSL